MTRRWAGVYSRSTMSFGRENDLAPFRFGFHQVAINQAHLDTKPGGNGHLALALDFNDRAHGDLSLGRPEIPTS